MPFSNILLTRVYREQYQRKMAQAAESSNNKYISLKNLFIFNASYGCIEGEEQNKILFYYPAEVDIDSKIKDVGLCEAIIKFSNTFTLDESCHCMRTQKALQVMHQPENDFWMVLTLNVPSERKIRDDIEYTEYKSEDAHSVVFQEVLKQMYFMFRLFHGTFVKNLVGNTKADRIKTLIEKVEEFYSKRILAIKYRNADILDIFRSIQYFPIGKFQFLRVNNFIQMIQSNFESVKHCVFLYNEQLVWSSINPVDLLSIYEYLTDSLFPQSSQNELRGGSLSRSTSRSIDLSSQHGLFITGPLALSDNFKSTPKVYIFNENACEVFQIIVYTAFGASLCMFVQDTIDVTGEYCDGLHNFIGPNLSNIASEIYEQVATDLTANKGYDDKTNATTKYLFLNELNCQHSGTIHLNQKLLKKKSSIPRDVMNLLNDLYVRDANKTNSSEVIVKTLTDYWIVKRTSNWRHAYIVFNKSSTLLEISDEANNIFDQHVNDVFLGV